MRFHLDRTLSVPLAVQLTGQIEYALTCGDLLPGQRLPTVRDLADELGVSPMTVSSVYRTLQSKGLVVSRVGDGTYVSDRFGAPTELAAREEILERAIDHLLRVARTHDVTTAELIQRLQVRQARVDREAMRFLFVGVFATATQAYADQACAALGPGNTVDAATIEELGRHATPIPVEGYDAILTIGYRVAEVESMVAGAAPVIAVPFLPSEETRTRLARLQPGSQLLAIATFPQFVGVLNASLARYAPHTEVTASGTADTIDLDHVLGRFDAVIYATGSEHIVSRVPKGVPAIEYRHVPDERLLARLTRAVVVGLRTVVG